MTANANPHTSAGLGCPGPQGAVAATGLRDRRVAALSSSLVAADGGSLEISEAMDRIRDEMAKHAGDGAIQMIGGTLTELLRRHPTLAGNLLTEGKSLSNAMKAMEAEARKRKTGSWACVDGLTGMKIVLDYYAISTILERELADAILVACGVKSETPVDEGPADEFDLDTLLKVACPEGSGKSPIEGDRHGSIQRIEARRREV